MSYDSLLIHTCYIGTATEITNEFGETKETWSYSSTETPCRFDPITLEEKRELGGDYQDILYRVFVKSGAAITLGSRIKYGSTYYLVRQRYYDSSGHHIECLVKEL
jgi:hypothetical protein